MTTTITLDENTKSRLEELQAEIRLETGKKVTQQELLSRLIDNAYESRDDIVDSFREATVPLTMRKKRRSSVGDSVQVSRQQETTSTRFFIRD